MKKLVLIVSLLGIFVLSACNITTETLETNVETEGVDVNYETMIASEVIGVLDWIVDMSGLDFEASSPSVFERYEETVLGVETLTIDGHVMTASGIPIDANNLEDLFLDNDRIISPTNIADGMSAGMVGYYKDGIGCVVYQEIENFDEEAVFGEDADENTEENNYEDFTLMIEINCGPIAVG